MLCMSLLLGFILFPGFSQKKLTIVTTMFPQFDFTRAVAGDKADITMLLKPGAESHSYEPTPKDIIDIKNSDLFIYVGGESDSWIDDILKDIDKDFLLETIDRPTFKKYFFENDEACSGCTLWCF